MRTNGVIQLAPLARILLAMAIGIWLGERFANDAAVWVWAVVLFILITAAVFLKGPKTVSTLILLISIAFGGLVFAVDNRISTVSLPLKGVECHSIVSSRITEKGKTARCDLIITEINGIILRKPAKVKASFLKDQNNLWQKLQPGMGVKHFSILKEPENFYNDSHFNYERWLKCHGYKAETFIGINRWSLCNVSANNLPFTERVRIRLLMKIDKFWKHYLQPMEELGTDHNKGIAIVAAMTLGDKSMINKKMKEDFSTAGASHILALSGLHLGIIYWILTIFLGRKNRRNIIQQTIILMFIWTYVIMAGMPTSIIRAATMLTIYTLAGITNRDKMSLNALALTAIIMLATNPLSLWDTGFQLSFMAMFGILTINKNLYRALSPKTIIGKWLWANIAISISAQIATAPLAAYYFGRISCYFILVNIIVIPLATIIVAGTITAWLATLIYSSFAILFYGVSEVAQFMYSYVYWTSSLHGASIEDINIQSWQVVLYYQLMIITLFVVNRKKFR